MIQKGIYYFCNSTLIENDYKYYSNDYIYNCNNCDTKTEHLFYYIGEPKVFYLTLITKLTINSKKYILYLYPEHCTQVLLKEDLGNGQRHKEIIRLRSLDGFTGKNLRQKVKRILNLKAFI